MTRRTIVHRHTRPVAVAPDNYNFNEDMANDAIAWLDTHQAPAPDKLCFLYDSPGTPHAPHHVGAKWIARYKGHFDKGWERSSSPTRRSWMTSRRTRG